MSWTAPMTAVAGTAFPAAQYNIHVRDNFLETAVAKVTAAGQYVVATAANALAARAVGAAVVTATETTGSSSYGNLSGGATGPAVTVTTGAAAFVVPQSLLANNTINAFIHAGYEVSGASSITPTDDRSIQLRAAVANQSIQAAGGFWQTGLTPGSNTFTMKYRTSAGTATYENRRLTVIPF